ncbi:hypothetical protein PVAG01_08620 [Phlyctema vagabunda]|uniref:OTU domain-containing protein n=1 Tax=Phlyctema vagabunda TaxID=108571 RepID=A0ABR4P9W8_9HELO
MIRAATQDRVALTASTSCQKTEQQVGVPVLGSFAVPANAVQRYPYNASICQPKPAQSVSAEKGEGSSGEASSQSDTTIEYDWNKPPSGDGVDDLGADSRMDSDHDEMERSISSAESVDSQDRWAANLAQFIRDTPETKGMPLHSKFFRYHNFDSSYQQAESIVLDRSLHQRYHGLPHLILSTNSQGGNGGCIYHAAAALKIFSDMYRIDPKTKRWLKLSRDALLALKVAVKKGRVKKELLLYNEEMPEIGKPPYDWVARVTKPFPGEATLDSCVEATNGKS